MKLAEKLWCNNKTFDVADTFGQLLSWREWSFLGLGWRRQALIAGLILLVLAGLLRAGFGAITSSQTALSNRYERLINQPAHSRVDKSQTVAAYQAKPKLNPNPKFQTPNALPAFFEPDSGEAEATSIAQILNAERFGSQHWGALYKLWQHESGWNPNALNPSSGACGIPQALPCRKIPDMSVRGQIEWGITYIQNRYGNPSNAWRHFQSHRWY